MGLRFGATVQSHNPDGPPQALSTNNPQLILIDKVLQATLSSNQANEVGTHCQRLRTLIISQLPMFPDLVKKRIVLLVLAATRALAYIPIVMGGIHDRLTRRRHLNNIDD